MRSIIALLGVALLAVVVQCSPDHWQGYNVAHHRACSPSKDGGCASCGVDFVQCGPDSCYNPKAGESCCSTKYPCPANSTCSALGPGCLPHNGTRRADCKDKDANGSGNGSSSSSYQSSTADAGSSMSTSAAAVATSYSDGSDSDSSSTTYTTTITSTTTNTVTVSETSASACGLAAATTGIPITTSLPPHGNSTTVAMNTTTSTVSVTNFSSSAIPASTSIHLNSTKPAATISPAISGYTGAGTVLRTQTPSSLFALGSLVFIAALII